MYTSASLSREAMITRGETAKMTEKRHFLQEQRAYVGRHMAAGNRADGDPYRMMLRAVMNDINGMKGAGVTAAKKDTRGISEIVNDYRKRRDARNAARKKTEMEYLAEADRKRDEERRAKHRAGLKTPGMYRSRLDSKTTHGAMSFRSEMILRSVTPLHTESKEA